jgi:hypothetical protein
MKKSPSFELYLAKLSPNRQHLGHLLADKNWFKNTDFEIKKQVLSLPDNFEGYIYSLTEREDYLGEDSVTRLKKIAIGEHLITSVFELKSRKTDQTYLKEYVSWCYGNHPGLKGLILIKTGDKITHFVMTKAEKFPVGHTTFDAIGGLTQYTAQEIANTRDEINRLIRKKLGVNSLNICDIYNLGHIEVDNGLTPNYPGIFAITVDAKDFSDSKRPSKVDIVPIEQLDQYIAKVDDSFFLTIISRLLAKKIITL